MNAPVKTPVRPLSPHLQVYRLPLAAVLSITHRITGVGLALGGVLLTWWLAAAAYGPDAFAVVTNFMGSWLGLLIILGFSLALYFHLCNGVRHLIWDTGAGFEKADTARSNVFVLIAAIVLTAVSWFLAVWL